MHVELAHCQLDSSEGGVDDVEDAQVEHEAGKQVAGVGLVVLQVAVVHLVDVQGVWQEQHQDVSEDGPVNQEKEVEVVHEQGKQKED